MSDLPAAAPEDVHGFWFGDSLSDPSVASRRSSFWFGSARETDEQIARHFEATLQSAVQGVIRHWELQARSCLTLILVLDQFPRNIYRGTAAAFHQDQQALAITKRGVAAGHLSRLHTVEQAFYLMPFQHVEDRASQREGLALFEQMVEQAPPEWRTFAQGIVDYARLHLEIVEQFGRFPHRNAVLNRTSTPAEREYLKSNTQTFGQSTP